MPIHEAHPADEEEQDDVSPGSRGGLYAIAAGARRRHGREVVLASATPFWDSNRVTSAQLAVRIEVRMDHEKLGQMATERPRVRKEAQLTDTRWLWPVEVIWLGGRDSNPDTVVQRRPKRRR